LNELLKTELVHTLGIPFAAPTVGDFRWRPPQQIKSWDGVLKADKFAPACPQANMPILGYLNYGSAYHGSDWAYVLGPLTQNPIMKYSEEDRLLS